ncbi:MAG: hypothetical protein OEO79_06875 [Gemmatimonadota bacterium]|nr:hypothetical protein [Gemmatimonadota bacterium]MDH3421841.1 hypothetical protein [Gemmatimonadota bacterium]
MKTVPRIGRILDLAGLLLFLGGGAIFVWAWLGFQGVPELVPALEEQARSAIAVANRYWRLQKIGTGFMIAGVAVFVLAWWVARSAMHAPAEPRET